MSMRALHFRRSLWILIHVLTVAVHGATASENAPSNNTRQRIEPADVFVRVGVLREELELIRLEMGRPLDREPDIRIANAAPREVFFQALALYRKADRLSFELVRRRAPELAIPHGEIRPSDVYGVVEASLEQVRLVKDQLGIGQSVSPPSYDRGKTPSDVFRSIMLANRQLNSLLHQPFASRDVFEQVTLAVGYTSRLLAQFPGARRIPEAPDFEPRKRSADVCRRLLRCYELIRRIGQASGVEVLNLEMGDDEVGLVAPSHVYDIASLLVAELTYLHSLQGHSSTPLESFSPGPKFPSHVYRRAGLLEAQLQELLRRIEQTSHGSDGS